MTAAARHGSRGFTLLELLLAMTMLAVLSVILFGGVRFGARVWEGGAQTLQLMEETHGVQTALRRMIGGARLPRAAEGSDLALPHFDGGPAGVTFAGLPPAPVLVGALYWMRVTALRDVDRVHLLLSWTFVDGADDGADLFADAGHRILLENIAGVQIEYAGAEDGEGEPVWLPEWRSNDQLPLLVRIRIDFPADHRRAWPELIIAVRGGGDAS